jgi:hypothetical protein
VKHFSFVSSIPADDLDARANHWIFRGYGSDSNGIAQHCSIRKLTRRHLFGIALLLSSSFLRLHCIRGIPI